jgi:hypothetical protein
VLRCLRDPDLCLPSNVAKVFFHCFAIGERRDEYQSGVAAGKQDFRIIMAFDPWLSFPHHTLGVAQVFCGSCLLPYLFSKVSHVKSRAALV